MVNDQPSAWNEFPTEDRPFNLYKYTGAEINFSQDTKFINRDTYGLLNILGDLGGVLDALYLLFFALIRPIAKFSLFATILSSVFR